MTWQKWCAKVICLRKYVTIATNLMHGAKNGRATGKTSDFAHKDVRQRPKNSPRLILTVGPNSLNCAKLQLCLHPQDPYPIE